MPTTAEKQAKEVQVKQHLHLVRPIAQHFAATRPDQVDDLTQVGAIGLLRAIERFDPSLGKPFEPYANTLIAGEIRHYLRDAVPLVRPPRELVELRGRVMAARNALGENVTAAAIAELADLPLIKVEEVLSLEENYHPASLDQELEAEGGTIRYQLVDNRYSSFQLATEDAIMLATGLARLRTVSREVIEFAFYDDLTQTEIAKMLGISQMQVSRRLKTAVGELWKALNTKVL
ncbi:MAG: polymerase subunit sigma [Cyanobacteria bacterium RYN_339]|nr:polymerase subunit sigma [Cyanobacteria bacterium RYN_339]